VKYKLQNTAREAGACTYQPDVILFCWDELTPAAQVKIEAMTALVQFASIFEPRLRFGSCQTIDETALTFKALESDTRAEYK
jgi:hypothetical protein